MNSRKGIGGRPRERNDLKSAPLSVRTDPALKAEIMRRAGRDGLSMTQEIERLIRLGLERDAA